MPKRKVSLGRPISWPTKITAPEDALEFYRHIARLQRSTAFSTCHIYHGAKVDDVPMIKFEKKVTALPQVIASYIGLPYGDQQCKTPGCCNPFHYLPSHYMDHTLISAEMPQLNQGELKTGLDEWVDLVNYYVEEEGMRTADISFEKLRPLIDQQDLSDFQLTEALKSIKAPK